MGWAERAYADNETIGGVRVLFNELLDSSVTPWRYRGYVDLGCIEQAPIAQAVTYQEHFCASSGKRVKDKKVVKEVSSTITVTLIEADPENLRLFFLGGSIASVVAGPGTVTDEMVKLEGTQRRILAESRTGVITSVTDLTGAIPYASPGDYVIEDYLGFKAIRRVAGGLITDGQYVLVDYTYTKLAEQNFSPLTSIQKKGKLMFQGKSDTGQNIQYNIDNCSLAPNGDFNYQNNDWTTMQLAIEILDNSIISQSTPFGLIRNFGTGPVAI